MLLTDKFPPVEPVSLLVLPLLLVLLYPDISEQPPSPLVLLDQPLVHQLLFPQPVILDSLLSAHQLSVKLVPLLTPLHVLHPLLLLPLVSLDTLYYLPFVFNAQPTLLLVHQPPLLSAVTLSTLYLL